MSLIVGTYRLSGFAPRAAKQSAVVFAARFRPVTTAGIRHHFTKTPPMSKPSAASENLLVQQRLRRPLAPHLSIYKWQITSVPSTFMRITGVALSGSFYLFGMAYLASPWLGLDLSSTTIAASFGALPVVARVLAKVTLAWPFMFHAFNGLRYLCWDMAIGATNKTVARTGWTVVMSSFVSALALATLV